MDFSGLGTTGALVITALAGLLGVLFKRSFDRRTATDAVTKAEKDRTDATRNDVYKQMGETLEANRAELRAVQKDLGEARAEMESLWAKMATMRRAVDSYEAHIAAWNRWADNGSQGPRPILTQGLTS